MVDIPGKETGMKYLCVCQRGNSRSVSMAYVLKDTLGQSDVLACGIETTSRETFEMLGIWADKIIVAADESVHKRMPDKFLYKVVWFDIGPDVWGNPMNEQLLSIMKQHAQTVVSLPR
jgi:hypothetical protein